MNEKTSNFLINTLLFTIFIYIFIYSDIVKKTIVFGINLWINNLIPSIFPILLITKLLIYYNIIDVISNLIGKYIELIFNISKNATFAIIASIFTGFPTGSIYVKDLLENNKISVEEANKLITFTSFANPLFVISFVGETLLNNKRLGIFIYIIHIITGLFIGIINKSDKSHYNNEITKNHNNNFSNLLIKSIQESFIILVNILGITILFLIISSLINTILPNNIISIFIKSILELTTGILNISNTKYSIRLKSSIIGFIISFNGLSVHYQIKSIIDNTQIKYSKYLKSRILHSLLCFLLIYLLMSFI